MITKIDRLPLGLSAGTEIVCHGAWPLGPDDGVAGQDAAPCRLRAGAVYTLAGYTLDRTSDTWRVLLVEVDAPPMGFSRDRFRLPYTPRSVVELQRFHPMVNWSYAVLYWTHDRCRTALDSTRVKLTLAITAFTLSVLTSVLLIRRFLGMVYDAVVGMKP
jgi:hypothetical protein